MFYDSVRFQSFRLNKAYTIVVRGVVGFVVSCCARLPGS